MLAPDGTAKAGTTQPPEADPPVLPQYRADLDGLRAIAVILVIVNHLDASLLPGGFLGVDVFFVISGFVITRSLVARPPLPPGAALLDFYRRRVQRLVPSLLVCVLVTALLTCLFVPDPSPSLATGQAALFGLANLQLQAASTDYFGTDAAYNTFTQTWSLGVEEQFYLLYPVLGLLLGFRPGRAALPRRFLLALAAIAALSLMAFVVTSGQDPAGAYLPTHLRLWELAAGCLLVPLERATGAGATNPRIQPVVLGRASGAALLALLALTLTPERAIPWSTPLAVLATAVLITAIRPDTAVHRLLAWPGLRHIGLISYPLYLWHWSVITLARWTVGTSGWRIPLLLLLMVAAAEATHRWVETPLRRGRWPGGDAGTVLGGIGLSGLVAAGMALLGPGDLSRFLYSGRPTVRRSEERRGLRVAGTTITADACLLSRSANPDERSFRALIRACTSPGFGPGASHRLFILGDSHAAALLPLANRLHARGIPLTLLSRAGCPFPATAHGHRQPGCERFQRRVARLVLEQARPGDGVLIAGYHLSHLAQNHQSRNDFLDARGQPVRESSQKRRLYLDALAGFEAAAQRRGVWVMLLGAGPRLSPRDRCLPEWFRNAEATRSCETSFQRDRRAARRLNRLLRREGPDGVVVLDPLPILCPEGCRRDDMRRLLMDDDHLSREAVLLLEPAVLAPVRAPLSPTAETTDGRLPP